MRQLLVRLLDILLAFPDLLLALLAIAVLGRDGRGTFAAPVRRGQEQPDGGPQHG